MKPCFSFSCRFNLAIRMEEFGDSDSLNLSPGHLRHLEEGGISGHDITEGDVDDFFKDYNITVEGGRQKWR